MSDLEILKKIKNGESQFKLVLWERYENYVNKSFFRYRKMIMCASSFDDFIQDSYIAFEKALDYLDIQKMEDSGCNSFGTIFFFFIKKVIAGYKRGLDHFGVPLLISDIFYNNSITSDDKEGTPSNLSAIKFTNQTQSLFSDELKSSQKEKVLENYLEKVSGDKKRTLELLLSGEKISNISRFLDKKYSYIYALFKEIKSDFLKIDVVVV
jgi:DNA-directed RNA polymerase specialized sigma subunit